ncbi:ribonuclease R [Clostridiaceae bacterium M8S5]|nr:ribonuclease R [Clostridiaceae bacterium M8S5]
MNTKEKLVQIMKEQAYKPLKRRELAKIFDIHKNEMNDFTMLLKDMEKEGYIIKTREETYAIPSKMNLVVGTIQGNAKGFGFVLPDDKEINDIFITSNNMNGAMHGDRVIVRMIRNAQSNRKAEGEIIRIIDRANHTIVGTFEKSKSFGFVVPDDERIRQDIFIPKKMIGKAKTGQKVVAKINEWPSKRRSPEGEIVEILGYIEDKGVDILSIIRKYDLPEEFPEKVINAAESIEDEVSQGEINSRLDLRDKMIFTIDGADAKDLDDAISLDILDNGHYRLGVHIADVTHYVKENSALDKEAIKRGTSVYLVDRVIPMLPRKLSNGVCSLHPNVDRLTLSCFMNIDINGKIVDHEIVKTVINSKERLTYTDISNLLENDDEDVKKRYSHIHDILKHMEELSKILRKKREKRGAIDFDFDEAKVILDEEGRPIEVKKAERRTANKLIEEFMLACNETVTEYMYWSQMPFVYRIHEEPDEERINEFNKFIRSFGYIIKGSSEVHPKELQRLLKKIEGKKEETVINTLMLRSLKKAKYSEIHGPHFGLAAEYYSHFTSPIRRYPDLQIHRIIKAFITNELGDKKIRHLKKILPDIARQSSIRERIAEDAERETEDYKMVEFMSDKIGEEYEGVISSVTSFGIFVELDNTIEGLVRISTLMDDYYIYDELNYCLVGERTRRIYKIGDIVKVRVVNTNLTKREIDFEIAEEQI